MGAFNGLLERLQTQETRDQREQVIADQDEAREPRGEAGSDQAGDDQADDTRGVVEHTLNPNRWKVAGKEAGKEAVNDSFTVVNDALTAENGGKWTARRGEKVAVNKENKWKTGGYDKIDRRRETIYTLIASGGVVGAFYTTLRELSPDVQITAYLVALALLVALDPLRMFRQLLAKHTRKLIAVSLLAFAVTRWSYSDGLTKVCYIIIAGCIGVAIILNNFWVKAEHFIMSESVQKGLRGDPKNRGLTSWQADGRRKVWSALDTIGVIAKDEDIDTIFKLTYLVGFWECYSFQNDQGAVIEDLNLKLLSCKATIKEQIAEGLQELESQNEEIVNDYNELVAEYNELADKYDNLEAELAEIRDTSDQEETEEDETEEAENPEIADNLPPLPSWATPETYKQVIELIDNGEPKRNIERLTGVSRYKIDQLRAIRDEATRKEEDEKRKIIAFG